MSINNVQNFQELSESVRSLDAENIDDPEKPRVHAVQAFLARYDDRGELASSEYHLFSKFTEILVGKNFSTMTRFKRR
jgi:hypothetical protein